MMLPSKNKDVDAYTYLYDKYAPALYGVILKLTPDVQIANYILEKSFLKIWHELNGYDASKGKIFSLMLRITLQECKTEVGLSFNFLPLLLNKEEHQTRLHQRTQRSFPDNQEQ